MNWFCTWQPSRQVKISYEMRVSEGNWTNQNIIHWLYQTVHQPSRAPPCPEAFVKIPILSVRVLIPRATDSISTAEAVPLPCCPAGDELTLVRMDIALKHTVKSSVSRAQHEAGLTPAVRLGYACISPVLIRHKWRGWNTFDDQAAGVPRDTKLIRSDASVGSGIWPAHVFYLKAAILQEKHSKGKYIIKGKYVRLFKMDKS